MARPKCQTTLRERRLGGTLGHGLATASGHDAKPCELQEGLRKMDSLQPRIHVSADDFYRLTRGTAVHMRRQGGPVLEGMIMRSTTGRFERAIGSD